MKSNFARRLDRLEQIKNSGFVVLFPDKECPDGEETYLNTPRIIGTVYIEMSWQDISVC